MILKELYGDYLCGRRMFVPSSFSSGVPAIEPHLIISLSPSTELATLVFCSVFFFHYYKNHSTHYSLNKLNNLKPKDKIKFRVEQKIPS